MNTATILVDNNKSQHRFLKSEHGFSLYLKYNGSNILFDFGASDVLTYNAELLDIDLRQTDCLVSSHSHYDHIDGLRKAAPLLKDKNLYVSSTFDLKKYGKVENNDSILDYLGANFNSEFLENYNISKIIVKEKLQIADNIFIVSNFQTDKDTTNFHRFVIEKDNQLQPDFFSDELCMVIEKKDSLVLIVGCSHPGILNIVTKVNSLFDKKIEVIIGGTHLSRANDDKINFISNSLIEIGIKEFYFCHCSGDKITNKLESLNQKSNKIGTGTTIIL
jgi:7,8-dihydropterin-6-yl-methyl-4-(beta-D-ribofuranosyl)aminobenzene 5'-phosphate synthase